MSFPLSGVPTNASAASVNSMQISGAPTGGLGVVYKLTITNNAAAPAYYLLHDSLTLPVDGDTSGTVLGPVAAGQTLNVLLGAGTGWQFTKGAWVSKTTGVPLGYATKIVASDSVSTFNAWSAS